jgi:predicted ribonuclease YlaK
MFAVRGHSPQALPEFEAHTIVVPAILIIPKKNSATVACRLAALLRLLRKIFETTGSTFHQMER